MINAIYGKKVGMTQVFTEDERVDAVSVILVEPNVICQVKTPDKDGYGAVQLGFEDVPDSKVNKPMRGHFEKHGVQPKRYLREVRVDDAGSYQVGESETVDNFSEITHVDVTGTSKGKGFQGVMKRHGFRGGPGGHGAHFHRAPGSIGQCATPSRVLKGVRLPGQMGCRKVTVRNLEVVRIDKDANIMLLKGAVPGGKGGVLRIRQAKK